jgi:hypothetical protein
MTKRSVYVDKKYGVYVDVEKGKVGLCSDLEDIASAVFTELAFGGLKREISSYLSNYEDLSKLTTKIDTLVAEKKDANLTRSAIAGTLKDEVDVLSVVLERGFSDDLVSLTKTKKNLEQFIKECKVLVRLNKDEDWLRSRLNKAKDVENELSLELLEGVKANLERLGWNGGSLTYKDLKRYYNKLVEDTKDIFKGSMRVKKSYLAEDGSYGFLNRRYTLVDIINKHLVHLKGRLVVSEEVEDLTSTTKRFDYSITLEVEDEDLELSYENFEKIRLALKYFMRNYD